jgi:cytochrome c
MPATIDSMSTLRNPTPPDSASLLNGRKYYTINCAVCHGMAGKGDGLAVKYGVFPFPLVGDRGRGLSDGYIFGMIRNGRGNMPPYNRIEEKDRWDVVNYVRGLQGTLPFRCRGDRPARGAGLHRRLTSRRNHNGTHAPRSAHGRRDGQVRWRA